ncbi:MAG: hypothetical protein HUJ57_05230 [Erysipelotrichaceae bacterium]|nr:hypothetical protein [Erysipelotrichaceae bacterium]
MKIAEIAELLEAAQVTPGREETSEIISVFAGDLMSDVLAMVQDNPETTLLVTGLCNMQTLNTVEMLDIANIVFCRGKFPSDQMINSANNRGIAIYCTDKALYEVCGKLYIKGLEVVKYEE